MACDCLNTLLKSATERVAKRNPRILTGTLKLNWSNISFQGNLIIPIETTYKKAKADGKPYKNPTTEHIYMVPTFCPFCGTKTSTKEQEKS
ncbi:hypothetical protein HG263_05340 [Pseudoalteromonas sp. JBTF-M23]|uniref:Uncharacterized protein n=1 Tax=Pseudoalteromonas caenipelagi TaxID=2726988 RepID=A0A849V8R8_9GAMM|nr:hypothetical protein [Pseudoalteromonas caenipelagi]NOU49959.1 hypothetical protein [Pseudoalteromonas caenipelagi]